MPIQAKTDLSHEYIRSLVIYDAETGIMRWRVCKCWRNKIGDEVGRLRPDGYRHVKIDGKMYLVHRLAWLYAYGEWPRFIDHCNMVRADNRLSNLRNVTQSQNGANRTAQRNNRANAKGVHQVIWSSGRIKWKAQIYQKLGAKKIFYYLGCFDNKSDAAAAYQAKAREIFGEFARLE
jgi:HNH endonuclease